MPTKKIASALLGALIAIATTGANAADTIHQQLDQLVLQTKGQRLAVLTNGSARTPDDLHDVDYMLAKGTTITAFFGPEHGFRGDLADGEKTGDGIDQKTSIPDYSLYGKRKEPTDDQLKNVDALVFDIPDIGARFYTYSWTLTHAMDAAARNNKNFYVVDRPNPITGTHVEGAVNTTDLGLIGRIGPDSPIGVATRHGLTMGELATYWNDTQTTKKVNLTVIKVPDWKRGQWWDETGREFIAPSPNMRTLSAAIVYPGTCIFEGTNMNEGRGTSAPFEMMGAPFVDGKAWAADLNARNLPGVKFEAITFTPDSRRYKNEKCEGVHITVTDREAFQPVRTGIHMLSSVVKLYPDKVKITDYAGRLMATPNLEKRIRTEDPEAIIKSWDAGLNDYKAARKNSLLYPE